jgi:hypothetical protein
MDNVRLKPPIQGVETGNQLKLVKGIIASRRVGNGMVGKSCFFNPGALAGRQSGHVHVESGLPSAFEPWNAVRYNVFDSVVDI